MQSLTIKIWQRSEVAVLAACLLFGAVLLALPLSWKRTLGRSVVATIFAPLEKPLAQLRSLAASRRENRELRERLARQELEHAAMRRAAEENAQLREMLSLGKRWQYEMETAEIAARQPGTFVSELTIDRGREKNLAPGMVVISTMGLVGRLAQVDDGWSVVQTVFHPSFRASAIDVRSRVLGITRYRPDLGLILDRVPLHSDIRPGDTLVSSGYGGTIPYGLMLGVVEEVSPDQIHLCMDITVRPSLDIDRLFQVFVITGGKPPPLPSLAPEVPDTSVPKPKKAVPVIYRPSLTIRPAQPPDELGGGSP